MKKIILSLFLLLSFVKVYSQNIRVANLDSFFNFKFIKGISASDALNDNKIFETSGGYGVTTYIFNESVGKIFVLYDGMKYEMRIVGNTNGNKDSYIYEYDTEKGVERGQFSFVHGDNGENYLIGETTDNQNPNLQKAWIALIKTKNPI